MDPATSREVWVRPQTDQISQVALDPNLQVKLELDHTPQKNQNWIIPVKKQIGLYPLKKTLLDHTLKKPGLDPSL